MNIFIPTPKHIFLAKAMDEESKKTLVKIAQCYGYEDMCLALEVSGFDRNRAVFHAQIACFMLNDDLTLKYPNGSFSFIPLIASDN